MAARSKVTSPLGRLQENFSWKDCLGTFLVLLALAALLVWIAAPAELPTWAYPLGVLILALFSAALTLGRRSVELLLRKLVGIGGLD